MAAHFWRRKIPVLARKFWVHNIDTYNIQHTTCNVQSKWQPRGPTLIRRWSVDYQKVELHVRLAIFTNKIWSLMLTHSIAANFSTTCSQEKRTSVNGKVGCHIRRHWWWVDYPGAKQHIIDPPSTDDALSTLSQIFINSFEQKSDEKIESMWSEKPKRYMNMWYMNEN
jgi:hypothetical protein